MLAPKDGKGPASDSPSQQLRLSTRRAPHAETPGPRGAGASLPDPTAGTGLRLSRQTSRTGPSGVSLWCLRASGGASGHSSPPPGEWRLWKPCVKPVSQDIPSHPLGCGQGLGSQSHPDPLPLLGPSGWGVWGGIEVLGGLGLP